MNNVKQNVLSLKGTLHRTYNMKVHLLKTTENAFMLLKTSLQKLTFYELHQVSQTRNLLLYVFVK